MNLTTTIVPKKRIESVDALRGFALLGIMLLHCMERFDLAITPTIESPFWQWIDTFIYNALFFLFAGKSYAIFSMLFGLSFFMQMESQADKGVDFRLRFLWRLVLLFVLGYINGLTYMGEFFAVYAVLGIILIPLYKVPTKWLIGLSILLFLQIPGIISFVSLLFNNAPNEATPAIAYMNSLYTESAGIYPTGSYCEVLNFNIFKGQVAKFLWVFNNFRYLQLMGLFIVGMLIGRSGIHKDEQKMVKYSSMLLPYSFAWFALFYAIVIALPYIGVEGFTLYIGKTLFMTFANLGMMMIYICGFILLYYRCSARKVLDRIAPVGRMSVTNYMMQSIIGVIAFYGFGLGLAAKFSFFESFLFGIAVCVFQVIFSNWWIKNHYYGPIEWLWRTATWFKRFPLKRA